MSDLKKYITKRKETDSDFKKILTLVIKNLKLVKC